METPIFLTTLLCQFPMVQWYMRGTYSDNAIGTTSTVQVDITDNNYRAGLDPNVRFFL